MGLQHKRNPPSLFHAPFGVFYYLFQCLFIASHILSQSLCFYVFQIIWMFLKFGANNFNCSTSATPFLSIFNGLFKFSCCLSDFHILSQSLCLYKFRTVGNFRGGCFHVSSKMFQEFFYLPSISFFFSWYIFFLAKQRKEKKRESWDWTFALVCFRDSRSAGCFSLSLFSALWFFLTFFLQSLSLFLSSFSLSPPLFFFPFLTLLCPSSPHPLIILLLLLIISSFSFFRKISPRQCSIPLAAATSSGCSTSASSTPLLNNEKRKGREEGQGEGWWCWMRSWSIRMDGWVSGDVLFCLSISETSVFTQKTRLFE